ncbi:hypothetical protein HY844_01940 [Candidatus Berkelbacteria bacterium]|nr:hypothetical protein [Candidatus Berkelbacteria bacterium]
MLFNQNALAKVIIGNKLLSVWTLLLLSLVILLAYARNSYFERAIFNSLLSLFVVNSVIFFSTYKNNKQIALAILLFIMLLELSFIGLFFVSEYSYVY